MSDLSVFPPFDDSLASAKIMEVSRHWMIGGTIYSILGRSFADMAARFDDFHGFLKTISACLKGKFLQEIRLWGRRDDSIEVRVLVCVDWARHTILANEKPIFIASRDKPLDEQVDAALGELFSYMRDEATLRGVTKLQPNYVFVPASPERYAEFQRIAGTVAISPTELAEQAEFMRNSQGPAISPGLGLETYFEVRVSTAPRSLAFRSRSLLSGGKSFLPA